MNWQWPHLSISPAQRPRLVISVLLLTITVSTTLTVVTGAIFTDTQSVGGNLFATGSIDIATAPITAAVTLSAMAPGDKVTSPIAVSNNGSLQLRYSLKSTTTEATLASQLSMTIKSGVTACTNAGFDASGTVVYGPDVLGTTAGRNVIGDPTQGQQAGDRTLNGAASETLCVQVALPSATGNTYQSLSTTATFDFEAEQTASN